MRVHRKPPRGPGGDHTAGGALGECMARLRAWLRDPERATGRALADDFEALAVGARGEAQGQRGEPWSRLHALAERCEARGRYLRRRTGEA